MKVPKEVKGLLENVQELLLGFANESISLAESFTETSLKIRKELSKMEVEDEHDGT